MSILFRNCVAQFKFLPRALILTLIIVFAYLFIQDNSRKEIRDKLLSVIKKPWLVLFLFFLSFILVCTLFSRNTFVPYKSVLKGFKLYNNGRWDIGCIENIILFVPYTFFYLQSRKPFKSLKSAFLLAFLTSIFIELMQLIFWLGAFQLSDLFYNVVGGVIGWFLWYSCKMITG